MTIFGKGEPNVQCPTCGEELLRQEEPAAFWSGFMLMILGVLTAPLLVGFVIFPVGFALTYTPVTRLECLEHGKPGESAL